MLEYNYTDELYHWKYIKKVKKNGKWRYYYDIKDALGYDEKYEVSRKLVGLNDAMDTVSKNEQLYKQAADAPPGTINIIRGNTASEWKKIVENNKKDQEKASREYHKALDKYSKTPIGKLDRANETIARGLRNVANWLDDVIDY